MRIVRVSPDISLNTIVIHLKRCDWAPKGKSGGRLTQSDESRLAGDAFIPSSSSDSADRARRGPQLSFTQLSNRPNLNRTEAEEFGLGDVSFH
ncbi:Hypothetical predicted protein [Cloeon dipterum]|uniref:Uncharacterized protein n=1 Tax=Cloeon dipterum TaxID=197152 RepID=A0A8S1DSC9_9INSE|nr:Hypothetical predicted protein [Cloeon dipterum]